MKVRRFSVATEAVALFPEIAQGSLTANTTRRSETARGASSEELTKATETKKLTTALTRFLGCHRVA